jgi:signal transduction histidine kinase
MDESDDFGRSTYEDFLNQESFSSKSSNVTDKNLRVEYKQGNQNIVTRIAHGKEALIVIDKFVKTCQSEINIVTDKNGISSIINDSEFTRFYTTLKDNSIIIKIVTEIDQHNIDYCKQIIDEYGVDLKHFSDVTFNLAISDDKEYVGFTVGKEKEPFSEVIYSSVKEIVEHNKFIFDTLWKKSIPIAQRRREIEEGLLPLATFMINSQTEALSYTRNFINNTDSGFSNSTSIEYFKLLEHNETLMQSYLQYLSKHKEGKVKGGVKWVTFIGDNTEDIKLIKRFLEMGVVIRHVKNLPPLYFSVSQKQCVVILDILPNGEMFQKIIHSTEPIYISHYLTVFDKLWSTGLDASERIRQIEAGTTLATTKIIENASNTEKYFVDIIKNAHKEILILFPSLNAIKREIIMGVIDLLKKKSTENVRVRILSPINERVKEIMFSNITDDENLMKQNITSREIRKQDYLISTIVIVDRKHVLATELKDDSKALFEEAIGVSTYSTSKPTILSYISIFESLWDQTEMSENLKLANEKLIHSEQLEREFINTAAHELRTPTQAIMGYAELGEETIDNILNISKLNSDNELQRMVKHLKVHLDALSRNSKRLDELINNLLDVARIESNRANSLQLHKEKLDLVKEINDSIKTQLGQKIKDKDIQISFINDNLDEHCWVYADKLRINQIMNNLLGNAIKFTDRNGKIDIIIKDNASSSIISELDLDNKKTMPDIIKRDNPEDKKENELTKQILVGISDTGKGISPQIMPKLFEKFMTGSNTGTGLGLYITKNIVEAHGGRIWAFNNSDGVGATFVFTLPKADKGIL